MTNATTDTTPRQQRGGSAIKSLAKDTAIYGISSIVGRFLNWMLVPLYTNVFSQSQYGVVTLIYAVVAIVLAVLVYGLETGFFRFANHENCKDPMLVYSTGLRSLAVSSSAFIVLCAIFLRPIADAMECADHPSFIMIMAVCVALDAFMALPYSYLRYKKQAMRFAVLRLINIGINIGLNLFFILLCPWLARVAPSTVSWFYVAEYGVGYIFLANLIATGVNMILMIPQLRGFRWNFDWTLWKAMIRYSLPLLVLGVAGMMNQTIDKILYPYLTSNPAEAMYDLGIYGANYKIGILLLVFLQAFRFAYEPFIFSRAKSDGADNKKKAYSDAMAYFTAFALLIFLGVMFYLDIIRYFISPRYFSGLKVVAPVMLGELFFGIFFNLSVWYKLTDRTQWGMWFSLMGLAVTLIFNIVLVPVMGYMGCALAAMTSYGVMMLASYFFGQKYYPIDYRVGQLLIYFGCAGLLYVAGCILLPWIGLNAWINAALRLVLLAVFVYIFMRVRHLSFAQLIAPIMHKFGRK